MIELFTHTLDVPTWFAIFVVCLLFWSIATSYAWYAEAKEANSIIALISIGMIDAAEREEE